MTDPNDQAARDSALNDAEFPDDERGLTGVDEERYAEIGATGGEGQTARDVFPEDNGVPDVSQDDFPTMQRSEDPEFAPEPGDRDSHETVSFGTTAFEQQEGEPLSARLAREGRLDPDDPAGHGTNVVPLRMGREELKDGYRRLMAETYASAAYLARLDSLYLEG
jgi:general stress protein YciG